MTINVVTSCSVGGWTKYGAKFVETFEQYWPKSIQLHVVSEDVLPYPWKVAADANPRFWPLNESESWRAFNADNAPAPRHWTHGDARMPRPAGIAPRWTGDAGYSFRHDAFKFSKKVFAIELVANSVKTGRLCWIDADVVTFAAVPPTLPETLLPASSAVSHLARQGYHSECGFVGYNLDHPAALRFIRSFAGLYYTGEVFTLAEWHDSWVFDWLRNKQLVPTHAIPHKSRGHPFINSQLGLYMDHLKGNRKAKGRSQAVEQLANPKLPYWQGHRV